MNSSRPCLVGCRNNFFDRQIGVDRVFSADAHGFVGMLHEKGMAVGIRKNGNCGNAHRLACAHDPNGNFATICYEDFIDLFHNLFYKMQGIEWKGLFLKKVIFYN